MICVTNEEMQIILRIIKVYAPDYKVAAFGSRYKWVGKDTSDLDLAFIGDEKLSLARRTKIQEAFDHSDLPYTIDVIDYISVADAFKKIIDSGNELIYNGEILRVGWRKECLGSICKTNQQTYSVAEKWAFVNYLDTANITENHVSEIQHIVIGQDTLPSRARRKVTVDDILYSTVRPNQRHYGIIKEMLPNMLVSTGFTVITADKAVADSDFLYYYLSQDDIVESLHAIGEQSVSAYPSIKPSDIEGLELLLPPLAEQVEIGHTLRVLDDKIALNREINNHLEQMAQAAFEQFIIADCADEPLGLLSDFAEINSPRMLSRGEEAVYIEMANLPTRSSFPMDWAMRPFAGGMKFTNGDTIGRYKLHVPRAESVHLFAEIAVPIMEIIRQNALECRNLTTLRNTLLPKLMSGELSVADAAAK